MAVLLSVILIFSAMVLVSGAIGWQLADLVARLPEYKTNLHAKFERLRFSSNAAEKVEDTLKEVSRDAIDETRDAQPVRIVAESSLPIERIKLATSLAAPAASAGLVVVLVIFMLISREDLRNRLVRLAGRKLALTTRTLDEIGARISRYLLVNAVVNGSFGIAVATGLWLIGVQYALTWGLLAALLRFLPYLGPLLASAAPVLMAVIQFPGWLHPLATAGLFLVLELVTNNVVEPLVYGRSTGVSTVALLVAAMFWTWIWGPIGLVLAVPLTVILAVIGEHITVLEPLAILLGDKPPLAPHVTYYQRLLAGDMDEGLAILQEHARLSSPARAYDEVVIPALVMADRDRERDELLAEEHLQLLQSTREFLEELAPDLPVPAEGTTMGPVLRACVVGCPAHDDADETALWLLRKALVMHERASFEILPVAMLASEMLLALENAPADAVVISALGPTSAQQARYLCKRLRQRFPRLRIVVGRWGFNGDRVKLTAMLKNRGADQVVTTISEATDLLERVQGIGAVAEA